MPLKTLGPLPSVSDEKITSIGAAGLGSSIDNIFIPRSLIESSENLDVGVLNIVNGTPNFEALKQEVSDHFPVWISFR